MTTKIAKNTLHTMKGDVHMKNGIGMTKLITIGGIILSGAGMVLSSISSERKMEETIEEKVNEALKEKE